VGAFTLTKLTAAQDWTASSVIPRLESSQHTSSSSPLSQPTPVEAAEPVDVEALCQAAREHGRQEAAAAFQTELESVQQLSQTLTEALDQLASLRRDVLQRSGQDVASLVTMLTRKIAGDSLVLDPEALPTLIETSIAELPSTEELQIFVSPGLLESTARRLPDALRGRLTADPEVDRGCVVRTRFATLDATLETAARGVQDAIDIWLAERGTTRE
jgi:flagellar biosynthesis/type III secretory pathway protein FliH